MNRIEPAIGRTTDLAAQVHQAAARMGRRFDPGEVVAPVVGFIPSRRRWPVALAGGCQGTTADIAASQGRGAGRNR
jgi:hypothetical protein